jgi:hypothetical protein
MINESRPPFARLLIAQKPLSYTNLLGTYRESKGAIPMLVLDSSLLLGLAALVTSFSALVWSIRRRA